MMRRRSGSKRRRLLLLIALLVLLRHRQVGLLWGGLGGRGPGREGRLSWLSSCGVGVWCVWRRHRRRKGMRRRKRSVEA